MLQMLLPMSNNDQIPPAGWRPAEITQIVALTLSVLGGGYVGRQAFDDLSAHITAVQISLARLESGMRSNERRIDELFHRIERLEERP